jgi:hypothetical protein
MVKNSFWFRQSNLSIELVLLNMHGTKITFVTRNLQDQMTYMQILTILWTKVGIICVYIIRNYILFEIRSKSNE